MDGLPRPRPPATPSREATSGWSPGHRERASNLRPQCPHFLTSFGHAKLWAGMSGIIEPAGLLTVAGTLLLVWRSRLLRVRSRVAVDRALRCPRSNGLLGSERRRRADLRVDAGRSELPRRGCQVRRRRRHLGRTRERLGVLRGRWHGLQADGRGVVPRPATLDPRSGAHRMFRGADHEVNRRTVGPGAVGWSLSCCSSRLASCTRRGHCGRPFNSCSSS